MTIAFLGAGARSELLLRRAFDEEALACPDIDERIAPVRLLYPRSFVVATDAMPGTKIYDYSFIGSLYRPETYEHRAWILDFARQHFTERSYLQISECPPEHTRLGQFDRTGERENVFIPKELPPHKRDFFDAVFYGVLRRSEFTLCPAGDHPWSMRFFEAIMCRSIPIVSDPSHVGRNDLERAIGYRVFLADEEHVYDEEIVEENHRLFIEHQTLIGAPRGSDPVSR
jgi:hypothetical protein